MVLLLFGPPGSGKGTQSRLITNWLHIPAISTGEMLRREIETGTELGKLAKDVMATGGLVVDGLVNRMLLERISQPDCRDGFLLDGYPRTVRQAEFLDSALAGRGLPAALVLHLDVPFPLLIERMTARRQCAQCGRTYNLLSNPPRKPGVCDVDGTPLMARTDDVESVFRERLRTYDELTRPVLTHYRGRGYHRIDGDRPPNVVFEEIVSILEAEGRIPEKETQPVV